ncbi:MAG: hypothetical protein WAV38_03600 [Xanthobacteraceae bacterium]
MTTDEFALCDNLAEIFGFLYSEYGKAGLHAYFKDHGSNYNREALNEAANDLRNNGLAKPAAIVAEFAASRPSETDLCFCPYMQELYLSNPLNHYNIDSWERGVRRRRQKRQQQLAAAKLRH